MKYFWTFITLFFCCQISFAQKNKSFSDSLILFQKQYINSHEVVKGNSRKFFRFFPPSKIFAVNCSFEKSTDTSIITMKTSGKTIPQKDFIRYGKISFIIHDTALLLTLYQSKSQLQNYLFIPFTDATTGDETYGSGRYIDILTTDIKNNTVEIDFNKAYNPYCAYSSGYNCPIPPKENNLPVAIKAGEKTFAKNRLH